MRRLSGCRVIFISASEYKPKCNQKITQHKGVLKHFRVFLWHKSRSSQSIQDGICGTLRT